MTNILPLPQELRPILPTIEDNVDSTAYRHQLLHIDELLVHGGVEHDFVQANFDYWSTQVIGPLPNIRARQQLKFPQQNIRALLRESFRMMMRCRMADSPRLKWFC